MWYARNCPRTGGREMNMKKIVNRVRKVVEKALKRAVHVVELKLLGSPEPLVERAPKPKAKSAAKTAKKKPAGKK
jgi:hypothetical protein